MDDLVGGVGREQERLRPQSAIEIVTTVYMPPLKNAPVRAHSGLRANEREIAPLISDARLCQPFVSKMPATWGLSAACTAPELVGNEVLIANPVTAATTRKIPVATR